MVVLIPLKTLPKTLLSKMKLKKPKNADCVNINDTFVFGIYLLAVIMASLTDKRVCFFMRPHTFHH